VQQPIEVALFFRDPWIKVSLAGTQQEEVSVAFLSVQVFDEHECMFNIFHYESDHQ